MPHTAVVTLELGRHQHTTKELTSIFKPKGAASPSHIRESVHKVESVVRAAAAAAPNPPRAHQHRER